MSALDKTLEIDLDWRQLELAEIKVLVQQSTPRSTRFEATLRALWTMLYAHFEGFCKYALQLYANELTKRNLTRIVLSDGLLITSLSGAFDELQSNQAFDGRLNFLSRLRAEYLSKAVFSDTPFETSNLWPKVLERMLQSAGLQSSILAAEERRLKTLVARRNDIAHGKRNVIKSLAEYQAYEDATLSVMIDIALGVSSALDNQEYLK